jgi:hypothetical protein
MLERPWVAAQLAASQEWLSFMSEWVIIIIIINIMFVQLPPATSAVWIDIF